MIAYLKGTLIRKSPTQVVVETGGVGYAASIPLSTFFRIGEIGSEVELLVHTHMTDSALALFGFATAAERDLFLKLIGISGIGPKLAMAVLSGIEPGELEDAVRRTDVARIARIPGIGKKTALRVAMELQDKIEKKEEILAGRGSKAKEDLVSALANLGFRRKEIEPVVDKVLASVPEEAGFERMLRECLKHMSRI